jgi:hypothetical protein
MKNMNKLRDNLEKIVLFVMMIICLISGFLFISNNAAYKQSISQRENALTNNNSASKAESAMPTVSLVKNINKAKIDLLNVKRNVFVPFNDDAKSPEYTNPVLELLDISFKPLGFQYQGRIVYPNGQIVAQINANHKSYLVKIGSSLANYKVLRLDKDVISLKPKQGKALDIKYLQTAFSEELMAKIKDNVSGDIETVYKNSIIYGYKVLDIEEDCVILSKSGQHLRLQKGTVQAK